MSWERIKPPREVPAKFGRWVHRSGWTVHHCGHPTALWPYYITPPRPELAPEPGAIVLSGGWGKGRAFGSLAAAQSAAEWIADGVDVPTACARAAGLHPGTKERDHGE